ncbi:DUF559 domain-containing protein [Luteococcus sp. H138]|uniref:endonuclease domain-containing protein n=1 Tax=unclassified Luteococcus TaxID=2639923 RepID=UPI00313CCC5B
MRLRDDWLVDQGGVVPRPVLESWGNDPGEIRKAVDSGALTRVRPGWFATPAADADVVRAVRAGTALSCVSVLRRHHVWSVDTRTHVRPGRRGLCRPLSGARICPKPGDNTAPHRAVDDLDTALLCASQCCADEDLLVLLDSVVNLRLRSREEVERLLVAAPRRVQRVVARMDLAESGTETMVRNRLRAHQVRVRPQVQIGDIGRVDLLVGTSLVIEIDSKQHHTSPEAYERDRERDRRLRALGYTVIRLTYDQVLYGWAAVETDILHLIALKAHLRRVEAS